MKTFKEINPSPRTLMTPGPVEADASCIKGYVLSHSWSV